MITTDLRELIREEMRKLPFFTAKTKVYEPRENDEMQMFTLYETDSARLYIAYFGVVPNESEGVFEIRRVGVEDAYKGKGWGRAVVELIERVAKESGYASVRIEKNKNPAFWTHLGYQPAPVKHEKLL